MPTNTVIQKNKVRYIAQDSTIPTTITEPPIHAHRPANSMGSHLHTYTEKMLVINKLIMGPK